MSYAGRHVRAEWAGSMKATDHQPRPRRYSAAEMLAMATPTLPPHDDASTLSCGSKSGVTRRGDAPSHRRRAIGTARSFASHRIIHQERRSGEIASPANDGQILNRQ